MSDSLVSAIASTVGIIVVAVMMMIAMALYGIGARRGHTQKQRVSVAMPVIDICRLAPSNVDQNSCIPEPQQPQDVYLPPRQPSPSARTASRYEETLRLTGLRSPSDTARLHLDLEAQSWKPAREKKNAKAELSHFFLHPSPLGAPNFPTTILLADRQISASICSVTSVASFSSTHDYHASSPIASFE